MDGCRSQDERGGLEAAVLLTQDRRFKSLFFCFFVIHHGFLSNHDWSLSDLAKRQHYHHWKTLLRRYEFLIKSASTANTKNNLRMRTQRKMISITANVAEGISGENHQNYTITGRRAHKHRRSSSYLSGIENRVINYP